MLKQNRASQFFNQDVSWDQSIFFPKGYEKLFLLIYFIFLPYITGIIFIFTVIAGFRPTLFKLIISNHNFLLTWALGYEVLALIVLLLIFKSAYSFIFFKRDTIHNKHRHRRKNIPIDIKLRLKKT